MRKSHAEPAIVAPGTAPHLIMMLHFGMAIALCALALAGPFVMQ